VKPLRRAVKASLGGVALSRPLAPHARRALRGRVNVVYAHYVGGSVPYYADFYVGSTREQLASDLRRLRKYVDFAPLVDVVTDGGEPSESERPRLAVTFDDGFDMIGNGVADLLEAEGVRATTFVITATVGNENLMWRNKLSAIRALRADATVVARYNDVAARNGLRTIAHAYEVMGASAAWPMRRKEELVDTLWSLCDMPPLAEFLDEHRPYFTWHGLDEWVARGHAVGLHTATHPYCDRLDADAVEAEVVAPARLLRERLSSEFLPLSYPFGARLPRAAEGRLYEAGVFDCAFGIDGFAPRGTAPYRLERACIEGELGFPVLAKALLGLPRR
jgi:peptidoglycan/xylan/chitin deacetylase (PgdA/CDA1 family)